MLEQQKQIDLNRGNELKTMIHHYDQAYYRDGVSLITDAQYDRLYDEYQALERQYPELLTPDSPTQRVGGGLLEGFEKFTHLSPLLSIDQKSKTESELRKWYDNMGGEGTRILIQPKLDGITINTLYEHHQMKVAATRGNGYVGENVTPLVKAVRSVPLRLLFEGQVEVRGEAIIPYSYFKAHLSSESSNPRNLVAGTMRSLDPQVVRDRRPDIIFYDLGVCDSSFTTDTNQLQFLKEQGFKVAPYLVVSTEEELIEACFSKMHGMIQEVDGFNVLTGIDAVCDGLVLKVDDLAKREALGMTSKGPRYFFAHKFESLAAETQLLDVAFQVGRTGRVTPVALLKEVSLGGTIVGRATLNNLDFIRQLGLKKGSTVILERSNDVIPKVIGLSDEDAGEGTPIEMPTHCPICQAELKEEYPLHFCENSQCPARVKGWLSLVVSRDALNMDGLGDSFIDLLVDREWVKQPSDLFLLKERHESDLLALKGYGPKKVNKIFESIQKASQVEAWRVLYALGIPNVGRRMSRELMKTFGSIQAILEADETSLLQVPDLGPSIVSAIREARLRFEATGELERLSRYLQMEVVTDETSALAHSETNCPLDGLTFVITGTLQEKRGYYQSWIESAGGKVSGSVSKKTSVVLVGTDAGSKEDKARTLIEGGAPICLLEGHEAFVSYMQEKGLTL